MNTPLVSVVIPAFNDQIGLGVCLDALAKQTWPAAAIEIIVVDNGSTPPLSLRGTQLPKVRIIRCLTPGSYAARNAGAAEAKGEVLAFTDADCRPGPDWLRNGVVALLAGGGERIIGGEVVIIRPQRPSAVALYQWLTGFGQEQNVCNKGFSATANLFCSRTLFDGLGPFEERLLSGGDSEWCWRAARQGHALHYVAGAVVSTLPRTTLRGAMRQARRVAAGRAALRRLGLAHVGNHAVTKQRSGWQAARWIVTQHELTLWARFRVLCVAAAIRGAEAVERGRLALGGDPERR